MRTQFLNLSASLKCQARFRRGKIRFRKPLYLLIFLVGSLPIHGKSGAGNPILLNEQKVRELLLAGRTADLDDATHFSSNRISGEFVRSLLLGNTPTANKRVYIKNAVVSGFVDCSVSDLPNEISLVKCTFEQPVRLIRSHFLQSAFFKGCTFYDFTADGSTFDGDFSMENTTFHKPANFAAISVGGDLYLNEATFFDGCSFGYAQIDGNFCARSANFYVENSALAFTRMEISGDTIFDGICVYADITFDASVFEGFFSLNGAYFLKPHAIVSAMSIKVDESISMMHCEFQGPVLLALSSVSGHVQLDRSLFLNHPDGTQQKGKNTSPSQDLTLLYRDAAFFGPFLKIGGNLSMSASYFYGNLNLSRAEIGGDLTGTSAIFNCTKSDISHDYDSYPGVANTEVCTESAAIFTAMTVQGNAEFSDSIFGGAANFGSLNVAGNMGLRSVRFLNPSSGADLNSMSALSLDATSLTAQKQTMFYGAVSLDRAQIERGLNMSGAQFLASQTSLFNGYSLDASGLNVSGAGSIWKHCYFVGKTTFYKMQSANVISFQHATFETGSTVNFDGVSCGGAFLFWDASIRSVHFSAAGLDVGGSLDLTNLYASVDEKDIDFSNAKVGTDLVLQGARFISRLNFENGVVGRTVHASLLTGNSGLETPSSFMRGFTFRSCQINGNVELSKIKTPLPDNASAQTSEPQGLLDFGNIDVVGSFILSESALLRPVILTNAEIGGDLKISSTTFSRGSESELPLLDLRGSTVFSELSIQDCTFEGPCDLSSIKAERSLDLQGTTLNGDNGDLLMTSAEISQNLIFTQSVSGTADLANTSCAVFDISDTSFLFTEDGKPYEQLNLAGFTSGSTQENDVSNVDIALKLFRHASFDESFYIMAEKGLRQIGHDEEADQMFFAMKARQQADMSTSRWLWDQLFNFTSRYGKRPWQLVFICLIIIGIGAVIFGRGRGLKFIPNQTDPLPSPMGKFVFRAWLLDKIDALVFRISYSTLLFLPFENAEWMSSWRPGNRGVWAYHNLHQILGWIAVPFAIALLLK